MDQILVAKEGSPSGDCYKRIDASSVSAVRQNRLQLAFGVVEINAVLTPVMAILQKLKLAPEQWMERMGYVEMLLCTDDMRCN